MQPRLDERAIDDTALFYLQSRGVPRRRAQALLVLAFLAEAIQEIADDDIAEDIRARLERWLASARVGRMTWSPPTSSPPGGARAEMLRQHLARGRSEPFAFSLLLVFLALAFVAQWPVAARLAHFAGEPSALPRILPRVSWRSLATIPVWYALAALSRLVARLGRAGHLVWRAHRAFLGAGRDRRR